MSHPLLDATIPTERRLYGVYTGTVVDNSDPARLGRVRATLPWLPGDYTTGWARVATPMSGAGFGVFMLPEPGDEVLLAFEHGDPARPIVIAGLWGHDRRPPEDNADRKNNRRVIRSRSGHQIVLDDTAGDEKVVVSAQGGKASLTLEAGTGDVVLSIGGQQLRLSGAAGTVTLQSEATLKVDLQGLEATLRQSGKVEAAQLELAALSGIAVTCLEGVNINAGALVVK